MLILVRHAMPAYEQSVPPELWPLSVEGWEAARALDLPAGAYLVASEEVKAWQTLEPFGAAVRDARFNEVKRRGEPWDETPDARFRGTRLRGPPQAARN
jgi:hypothetical protein